MISIVLLYAVCAITFTLAKESLNYATPFFFLGARMLLAGIFLIGYCCLIKKQKLVVKKKDIGLFIQIILFHVYCAYALDLWSLQYLTSSKSAFLFNLSPFVSAIFSYYWFNEYMTPKKWGGLLLGFAGFLPILLTETQSEEAVQAFSFFSWPELLTIGAVISAVYGWIVMRKLVKEGGYTPEMVNGIGMFVGGLLAFATSYAVEGWQPLPVTDWTRFIQLTLMVIVTANIIFYNFYGHLLKKYTATLLSFAGFTCPLWTALFGWWFLGESVSVNFFISTLAVSIGLFLFYQEELRQGYTTR